MVGFRAADASRAPTRACVRRARSTLERKLPAWALPPFRPHLLEGGPAMSSPWHSIIRPKFRSLGMRRIGGHFPCPPRSRRQNGVVYGTRTKVHPLGFGVSSRLLRDIERRRGWRSPDRSAMEWVESCLEAGTKYHRGSPKLPRSPDVFLTNPRISSSFLCPELVRYFKGLFARMRNAYHWLLIR